MANGDPRYPDAPINALTGNFGPAYGPPPPPTGWNPGAAPTVATTPTTPTISTTAPLPNLNVPTTGLPPQALQSQAEMGQEMMKEGTSYGPVRSWTQGMARLANALVGGYLSHDAYQRQMEGYNAALRNAPGLVGGGNVVGSGGYVSEGAHQTGSLDTAHMDPTFLGRMNQLMSDASAQGVATHMVSGYRDTGTQARLYANYQARLSGQTVPYPQLGNGGLAAPPGMSMHNVGRASDILANDPKQQSALIALARQPWRGIRAGADFGDNDHFEAAEGRTAPLQPYGQTLASQ
jgi:hypothetical protein